MSRIRATALAITALAITALALLASPAVAKKSGGKVTGVYCAQGPDNAYFPASEFKASVRAKMYKGQKVKFNYPGYGPITCVVY